MTKEKTMVILGRAALIKKRVMATKLVDFGNGCGAYVKELTAEQKNDYEASLLDKISDGKGGFRYEASLKNVQAKLLVYTACDEKGKLIFKKEEAATLSQNMPASEMDLLIKAAKKLNRLEEADKDDKVKN